MQINGASYTRDADDGDSLHIIETSDEERIFNIIIDPSTASRLYIKAEIGVDERDYYDRLNIMTNIADMSPFATRIKIRIPDSLDPKEWENGFLYWINPFDKIYCKQRVDEYSTGTGFREADKIMDEYEYMGDVIDLISLLNRKGFREVDDKSYDETGDKRFSILEEEKLKNDSSNGCKYFR